MFYYYPKYYIGSGNKTLLVYFNSVLVFSSTVNSSMHINAYPDVNNITIKLSAVLGQNNISVTMTDTNFNGYGFLVKAVRLYPIDYQQ